MMNVKWISFGFVSPFAALAQAAGIFACNPPSACQALSSECLSASGRGVQNERRKETLVAVFILFSGTTDAFQMAKWSSKNVIPSKIALGVVFAILGILMLLIR